MRILVTGAAGFIGSHLAERLVRRGDEVVGFDNFDPFYDRLIKQRNLSGLVSQPGFTFVQGDILDAAILQQAMLGVDAVVHLAALAGVRPSLDQPARYMRVNVEGTVNLLQLCQLQRVQRVVVASSSSVYGRRSAAPFREGDRCDQPASPYAASKHATEAVCYTFHELHALAITCLRYFTVYGPRQRPEMAIHKFVRLALEGKPIPIYGDGRSGRDYTFIDDIVAGTVASVDQQQDNAFRVYNLGGAYPVELLELVRAISRAIGTEAEVEWRPSQPGDVPLTCADITLAGRDLGYAPGVALDEGLRRFVEWYRG